MSSLIIQFFEEESDEITLIPAIGESSVNLALRQFHALDLSAIGESQSEISNLGGQNSFAKAVQGRGKATVNLNLSVAQPLGSLQSIGTSQSEIFLRLNDEPNRFLELNANGTSQSSLILILNQDLVLSSRGTSNPFLNLGQSLEETGELVIFLDILPEISTAQSQTLDVRFLVNETEIPIKRARYREPAGTLGAEVEVELSKPDLSQFNETDDFVLQVSQNGAMPENLFAGKFSSHSLSISFERDTLFISSVNSATDKLETAPRVNSILYDGNQINPEFSDADLLRDNLGNSYPYQKTDIRGLRLYDLLQRAFVTGCGFSQVFTNLPNFPVLRADFPISQNYKDSIAGFIGAFEPVFLESSANELWILDTTAALPSGFTPRTITPSRFQTFIENKQFQELDGLVISYTENADTGLLFFVITETEETISGSGDSYQRSVNEKTIRQYYRSATPSVIERKTLQREVTSVYNSSNNLIAETTIDYTLDPLGNLTKQRTLKRALVPELSAPFEVTLDDVRDETVDLKYRYDGRRATIYEKQTRVRGLIATDEENTYLDEPFKQDFSDAHSAGNLKEGMTLSFGAIKTVIENFSPSGNGQTRVKTTEIDFLRKTVLRGESETYSGEANQPGQISRRLLVWRDGVDLMSVEGKQIGELAVGTIPLRYALPLAKRKLARKGNQTGNATLAGFEKTIRRGTVLRVTKRNETEDFLTLGREFSFDNLGTRTSSASSSFELLKI